MEIMRAVLNVIYYAINILILIHAVYYFITGIFVFFNNRNTVIRKYRAKNKFAILIAARNEEKVIGKLLESLKRQNYPQELYDIYVIPNKCSDNTKDISIKNGASIIECNEDVSTKGDVLKFAFGYMANQSIEYDAYIVFDADNIVHPEFITRMNDALCSGYKVAQGYRDSKNVSDSWISSCYSIYYMLQNFFFNKSRKNMGLSASINGTGFMLSREVLEKYGFNTVTITEDIEFSAQCSLNNEKIAFVEDAITYDEQPIGFGQSWHQRKRWSTGTLQCLKVYVPKLIKSGIKNKSMQCIDMAIFFLAPVMQVIAAFSVLFCAVYGFLSINLSKLMLFMYNNLYLSAIIGYILAMIISIFVILVRKSKIRKILLGVITFPFFMITWIPINLICMIKKENSWRQIDHIRDIDIESIVDETK